MEYESYIRESSLFRLLRTDDAVISGLNRGYNGDTNIGFFHAIGMDENDNVLYCKPTGVNIPIGFIVTEEEHNTTVRVLVSFMLYNN